MSDFWKEYEQEEQEAASGGIIGKMKIDLAWKTFPPGVDQELTFFPAPPCPRNASASVKEANTKAQLAAKALGGKDSRDPSKGFYFRVYRDNAVSGGRAVTWQGDRFFFEASWTEAGKRVKQSLVDAGISQFPWEGYARIGFFDNPYHVKLGEAGMKKRDQNDNPAFPTVAYIIETFSSEEAARTAIGTVAVEEGVSVAGQSSAPEGWDADSWKSVWPELYAAKESGKNVAQIAGDYSVKPGDVASALSQYIPM